MDDHGDQVARSGHADSALSSGYAERAVRVRRGRPFEAPGRRERIVPFAVITSLSVALMLVLPAGQREQETAIAALVLAAILAIAFLAPWGRLPPWAQALPPLAYYVVVALIRDDQGGGESVLTPLVALPVFWFALYGTRTQLRVAIVAAGAMLGVPIAVLGAPGYPASELIRVALYVVGLGIGGLTVNALVQALEGRAAQSSALARTDELTGIPNRRGWQEQLDRELARSRRDGRPLCVAIVDLDHFKSYNDRFGHAAGDRLLQSAATGWADQLRETDVIARYGGEEFAVTLPASHLQDAKAVMERVRQVTPHHESSSVGIARWNEVETADELLARADAALYEAKRSGRDRVVLADAPSRRAEPTSTHSLSREPGRSRPWPAPPPGPRRRMSRELDRAPDQGRRRAGWRQSSPRRLS